MKSDDDGCNNKHLTLMALIACLGGLLFGFDTGIIADVHQQVVHQFHLNIHQWSLIVSITVISAFVGALTSAKFSEIFGRKRALILLAYGFILATLILTCATGFYSLFIGRLLIGFCIGIASYITPLFIAELSPKAYRGRLVLFNSIAITVGECISFLCGYTIFDASYQSWRLMFFIGVIPAVILLLGMKYVPQSPRWLALKGRFDEAKHVLYSIRNQHEVANEWQEIKESIKTDDQKMSLYSLLNPVIRPVVFLGMALGILQQFAGINTVMYYGPHIFLTAGIKSTQLAIAATFLLGLTNVVGTIIVVLTVDTIGRRRLMMMGTFLSFICLGFVAYFYNVNLVLHTLIAMILYIFFYAISLGSLFWLIIAEIYPAQYRSLAMSSVTAIQWLANFIIAVSFLPLQQYFVKPGILFYFFSLMCFLAFIITYFYVPETKGMSLEHIEKNVLNGCKLRYIGES
jgi:MFS transporter, SP family, galactose:H+ symporter